MLANLVGRAQHVHDLRETCYRHSQVSYANLTGDLFVFPTLKSDPRKNMAPRFRFSKRIVPTRAHDDDPLDEINRNLEAALASLIDPLVSIKSVLKDVGTTSGIHHVFADVISSKQTHADRRILPVETLPDPAAAGVGTDAHCIRVC
jgi:hypothetical protein